LGLPLLKLEGVGKSFGGTQVLQDVSLELRAGEVHVLAGENGAGKSTLIKILAGVHVEYEGRVLLKGRETRFKGPQDAALRGVSVIHQELSLVDGMSVTENIFLGRERTRRGTLGQWLTPKRARAEARELCRRVGLEIDVDRRVEEFPLAVKNGIEIAKALAQGGEEAGERVLIMDEPTSALNAPEAERLFGLIRQLKARGYGIIYISHKMDEIYRLADRITVLRDGRWVGTAQASELPQKELVKWMIGREMNEQFPPRKSPWNPEAPVRMDVSHATGPVVRDASFAVRAGEILGIAGLQGSGNSELLNTVFGSYGKLARAEVRIDGQRVQIRSPREAIRRGLALLTNDRKATGLVLGMGIRENVTLASLDRHSPGGWILGGRESRSAERRKQSLRIRSRSIEQEVGTLSGGNQQKVALAKWLETEPCVLLLDEPTRGVDVGAKHEIYELIRGLTEAGHAIVLITSEMAELLALSDRILVMHRGEIAAEFAPGQATQEKILEAAMGIQAAETSEKSVEGTLP
jgi:ABC-type sugar transport system ATPase subunit